MEPHLFLASSYDVTGRGLRSYLGRRWDAHTQSGVQGEKSGSGGPNEGLGLVPSSAAGVARHLGVGLGEPVESGGLIIPSINDKPPHFQAFMINSWPYLMCSLTTTTFPGTAGRCRSLGCEAGGPYGHLRPHTTSPVPSGLRRPLCWAPGTCSLQAWFLLPYPQGK